MNRDIPRLEHRIDVVDVTEEVHTAADAGLGRHRAQHRLVVIVSEQGRPGELKAHVALGKRRDEGIQKLPLSLPRVDPREHADVERTSGLASPARVGTRPQP